MPSHGPTTTEPTCPRCGYDQSGEVAAWDDRCPLRGQCPECGTRFDWSFLFDPSRQSFPWLVEHTRSIRGRARRTIPTLLCLVLPWVFWSRVDVHARTDARAVVGWLLMLFIGLHLLCWLPFTVMLAAWDLGYALNFPDLSMLIGSMPGSQALRWLATGLLWPVASVWYNSGRLVWGDVFYREGVVLISAMRFPLGMSLTWFTVLFALPITRSIVMLRIAHLQRAVLFQLSGIIIAFSAIRLLYIFGASGTASVWVAVALFACYVTLCVWTLVWWVCAVRVGWRIRSWTLLILGTVAAVLGGVALSVVEIAVSGLARML